jgi:ferredoxin
MVSKKIVLRFPAEATSKPIVCYLCKDYNLVFNIIKAQVTPDEEGVLVLELRGEEEDYKKGIEFLKGKGITIEPFSKDVYRNDNKCTQCSACIVACPTAALSIKDRKAMKVEFDDSKCVACEACVAVCPYKAMEVSFKT